MTETLDASLRQYVREVLRFAAVMNLTSARNERDLQRSFIKPSLALLEWLPENGRLLDIGSGMGVPGVPLLLARRNLYGVLVERRRKRAEFLRHLVRCLELSAEVHDKDISDLSALEADVCVARAVAKPLQLLIMCRKHIVMDGWAILPVARDVRAVQCPGWELNHAGQISVGQERQAVHVYKRKGGFT
ncbi:MAG: RsmG family class I SAM-dependent methyltransferase [Mariprofundaceae bacterium]